MNIQQFQYVLAVAEHRHFETAAERCYVSQSTLSTMILKFEDEIGISIFDRKKRPMEITQEGGQIIERLKIIIKEIENLTELTHEIRGVVKGQIKIGCIPTVAPFLLPLFLVDFVNAYPKLKIEVHEITTDEIVRRLTSRELDIGIVSTPINEPELLERPLYSEPFVLYDTGNKKPDTLIAANLDMENFWLMEEGHCLRSQILDVCNRRDSAINSSLNINFKAASIGSLIRFVKANKGRTLLPALATANFSADELKFVHHFKEPVPFRTIGLLTHHHFPKERLLDVLQKKILNKIEKHQELLRLD